MSAMGPVGLGLGFWDEDGRGPTAASLRHRGPGEKVADFGRMARLLMAAW